MAERSARLPALGAGPPLGKRALPSSALTTKAEHGLRRSDGLARRRRAIDKITPSPHLRMAALLQKKALLHRAEEGEQAGGHGKRVPEAGAKGGSKKGARCPATCR
jgi:hypothetical protein